MKILLMLKMLKNSSYCRNNFRTDLATSKTWKTVSVYLLLIQHVMYKMLQYTYKMELIEIQENSLLKSKFEDVDLCDFSKKYLEEDNFPQLRKFTRRLICAFGNTYKYEQFFSLMKVNKSTHRTRLTDDNLENSLRLCISGINPNIDGLVSQIQAQVSH